MHSTRGQANVLGTILILAIVITIVIGTFTWGQTLLEAQESQSIANYMQTKLLQVRNGVMEVAQEGENATRVIRVDLSQGRLTVESGAFCTAGVLDQNAIQYELAVEDELIQSQAWAIIDPSENSTACNAPMNNQGAGVLIARAVEVDPLYSNQYRIWFRNLTVGDRGFLINLTKGRSSIVSGGTTRVTVQNQGIKTTGGTTYINVGVSFE